MSITINDPISKKPKKVQAISIMTLINGIVNVLWAFIFGLILVLSGYISFGITMCCLPLPVFPLVVGILEIVAGAKLLGEQPRRVNVNAIAILEIINIISLAAPSLVIGILNLVFYSDPKVKAYINSLHF
jgi:hypothetical protein